MTKLKEKKKAKGGSKKGSPFERWVCKALSGWWSGNGDAEIFWRTPASGSKGTNRSKKGKKADRHQGDLLACDPSGEPFLKLFAVEIKRGYSRDTVQDLLDRREGSAGPAYERWIGQAAESALRSGALHWLVVLRRDRRRPLVMMESKAHTRLCMAGSGLAGPSLYFHPAAGGGGVTGVTLSTLDAFLGAVTPEIVQRVLKNHGG